MQTASRIGRTNKASWGSPTRPRVESVFGEARNFLHNKFIYVVISQRARGLSIGVNMNPDQCCNFQCVYCEVARSQSPSTSRQLDVKEMADEFKKTFKMQQAGEIQSLPEYRTVPEELFQLRMVALSGDGEPTLCPVFADAVQELVHLRAQGQHPFFKLVLITNASGLHLPAVRNGLQWFTGQDEVWTKLDAGTPSYMSQVNRTNVTLDQILNNILSLGRQRPIVIQSLFPLLEDHEPPAEEIKRYVENLAALKSGGAQITGVQVYSAHRPTRRAECRHLSLKCLSQIAQQIRSQTGLEAEVF
jgi:wyosine [tRNA(Phe)-imidazoG37] synthetase (radical SAM superfamily)